MVRPVCKLLLPCCLDEAPDIDQGEVLLPQPQNIPIQPHQTNPPRVLQLLDELKRFGESSMPNKRVIVFNRLGNDAPAEGIARIKRAANEDAVLVLCFYDQNTTFKHQLLKGLSEEKNVLSVSYEDLDEYFVNESSPHSDIQSESRQLHKAIAFIQQLIRVNMIGKAVDIGLLMDSLIVSTLFKKNQLLEGNEVMVSHEHMTKEYDQSVHQRLEKHARRRNQLVISAPTILGKFKLSADTHLALADCVHVGVDYSYDDIQSFLRRTQHKTEDAMEYGNFASSQSRLCMATERFYIDEGACSIGIDSEEWRYVDKHAHGSWARQAQKFDNLNQLLNAMVERIRSTGKIETLKHLKDAIQLSDGKIKNEVDLLTHLVQHMPSCGVSHHDLPASLVVKSTDPNVLAFMKSCGVFEGKPLNAEYAYRSLRHDVPKFKLEGDPVFKHEHNFVALHRPKKDYKQAISPEQNEDMLKRQLEYNKDLQRSNPRNFQKIKESSDLLAEQFKIHPWYEKAMSGQKQEPIQGV